MAADSNRRLLGYGAVRLLLGLLSGGFIPLVTKARMGLSAHLAGVQNGMLLMIAGLGTGSAAVLVGMVLFVYGLGARSKSGGPA